MYIWNVKGLSFRDFDVSKIWIYVENMGSVP